MHRIKMILSLAAALLLAPTSQAGDVVCAAVTIKISQKVVVTRQAFDATLTITNSTDSLLEDILATLIITDEAGNNVTASLFNNPTPTVTGASNFLGSGNIGAFGSASGVWQIVAQDTATAGSEPSTYYVGGKVTHSLAGTPVVVDLVPQQITVHPEAKLQFDYYLQTIVYSDNPFTPTVIEPAEPFSLGLRVHNDGFGTAKNVTITSALPEIVENKQGLLISFDILGAQVCYEPVVPLLEINLGDIPPGTSKVARWLLTSSLKGEFTEMSVTWKHITAAGDEDGTSLIENVTIRPLVHMVDLDADSMLTDGCPDFLMPAASPANPEIPVAIESSDGQSVDFLPVVSNAIIDGPLTGQDLCVVASVSLSQSGWNYVAFPDPGNGFFSLEQVVRKHPTYMSKVLEVGGSGDISNVWTTTRPKDLNGDFIPDVTERVVHILDFVPASGAFDYELTYIPLPQDALKTDLDVIQLTVGGTQNLTICAPPSLANKPYIIFGSTMGTDSIPIGYGLTLPLNVAGLYELATGVLNAQGVDTVPFIVPTGLPPQIISQFAGTLVYNAAIIHDGTKPVFVTNPAFLLLAP